MKYLIIFFLIVLIMLPVLLETHITMSYYLLTFVLVSLVISIFSLRFKYNKKDLNIIPAVIIASFIFTYFFGILIVTKETDAAYSKINSVPKDSLVRFYKTNDINVIPKEYRYAWIGVRYRSINIVPKNSIRKIKAVGWKTGAIFAYYNIDEDTYSGSYH